MISDYFVNYLFNDQSIQSYAPESRGVCYCGQLNPDKSLGTLYVGRAAGEGVTIKNRLLNHLQNEYWPDVTHYCYRICSTEQEAQKLELAEILRLHSKYNQRTG